MNTQKREFLKSMTKAVAVLSGASILSKLNMNTNTQIKNSTDDNHLECHMEGDILYITSRN